MVSGKRLLYRAASAAVALLFLLPAYSRSEEQAVKTGDEAAVHFTCRFPNGAVAASSYQSVAQDASLKKSAVFWQRTKNDPIAIVAGKPSGPDPAERSLEDEILYRLANPIVGFRAGENKTIELKADARPEKAAGEYVQKLARVRHRVKEMRLTPDEYKARAKKSPEMGQSFVIDPVVPGAVTSVADKEVVITFTPLGKKVPTPLGEGTVKELPDQWEIVIDAHPGALVRAGAFVGRIISVDDKFITIDYGNPFGGETLTCDVQVESVKAADK